MLRIVVIVAIRNKRHMSLKITKSNMCVIGMLIGIGLVGLVSVLHEAGHQTSHLF
jgi:hypothetical protein